MKRSNQLLTLFVVAALAFDTDLSGQRRGGGGNNVNVNQNVNVNRSVNVNTSYHGGGYYGGGCCCHPVATAAAVTAIAVVTAAVIGSIVDRPPAGCVTTIVNGLAYQQLRQHLVSTSNGGNDDNLCCGQPAKMTHRNMSERGVYEEAHLQRTSRGHSRSLIEKAGSRAL
jgi:hypothetical protein